MPRTKLYLTLAVVSATVVGVGFLFITNSPQKTRQKYTSTHTPTAALLQQSQNFSTAAMYRGSGDYAKAEEYYRKALADAKDETQRAQIEFNIALMTEIGGHPVESIALYKDIAANTANYTLVRAYAVQQIGTLYFTYYGDTSAILAETFKGTPYASFREKAGSDTALAYRLLFEYASSIYPLAVSESRIGEWYATNLRFVQKGATTTPAGIAAIARIKESLVKTDADIIRTKDDPVASASFPEVYVREGGILANLAAMGVENPTLAEEKYKKGLQYAAALNDKPGSFSTYHYAAFLASQFGPSRSDDIQKLLAVFRQGNEANINPNVPPFFQTARTGRGSPLQRAYIKLLAKMDPKFKEYLVTLGWHAEDF